MSPYCRVSLRQQITDDFKMWKKRRQQQQQQIKKQQNKTPQPSVSITDLLNLYMYANIYVRIQNTSRLPSFNKYR